MSQPKPNKYDVVIVGGGHNGLVAAAYLARAGKQVCVLERAPVGGGAATSAQVFPGVNVSLSRYAYLLSLFPQQIIRDLGLNIQAKRRAIASYTPTLSAQGEVSGLLIDNGEDQSRTQQSFEALTGSAEAYRQYQRFNALTDAFADVVFPTLLEPLPSRDSLRIQCESHSTEAADAWRYFVEEPLGNVIEAMFKDDTIRGSLFTDAKIGVLTHPHDETLLQNRTFLYHILGQDWRVPIGGMGAVSAELERAARQAGATIITSADVTRIDQTGTGFGVTYQNEDATVTLESQYVLANVSPYILEQLMRDYQAPPRMHDGAVFKVNIVLEHLPTPRDPDVSAIEALTGTFHLDEGYVALQRSYEQARAGSLPETPPGEMYCHSLTDTSITGDTGYQTLTLFGLDVAYGAFNMQNNAAHRATLLQRYLDAINQYFIEPIQECIAHDANGALCIEAKSPLDIEQALNMPGANIFHTELSWPFAEGDVVGTWGVETNIENLLLCGSGAWRGGCVSGIPGHNAAMYILQDRNAFEIKCAKSRARE
jgi:phytoene dehydrogenase-like protein